MLHILGFSLWVAALCVSLLRSKPHCWFFPSWLIWVVLSLRFCSSVLKCHLHTHTHTLHGLGSVTFIRIKDWKGAPKPQHNLHLKDVVDGDADDEEHPHTTEHSSNRKNDIGIYRYEEDTMRTSSASACLPRFTGSKVLFEIFPLFQPSRARMANWFEISGYVVVAVLPDGSKVKYAKGAPLALYARQV